VRAAPPFADGVSVAPGVSGQIPLSSSCEPVAPATGARLLQDDDRFATVSESVIVSRQSFAADPCACAGTRAHFECLQIVERWNDGLSLAMTSGLVV
jgi:hypothetical protein